MTRRRVYMQLWLMGFKGKGGYPNQSPCTCKPGKDVRGCELKKGDNATRPKQLRENKGGMK